MGGSDGTCAKCGGRTVSGYAADRSEHYFVPLFWLDGEPERVKMFGITGDNLTIGAGEKRMVRGFRCEACGYLELYAVPTR